MHVEGQSREEVARSGALDKTHGPHFADGAEQEAECDPGSRPLCCEGIVAAVEMEDVPTFQLKE